MRLWPALVFSLVLCAKCICMSAQAATSQAAAALYNQGNQFYAQAHYEQAQAAYESVLAAGVHNANLYYNLGNAYLKDGKLGPAILSYRMGLKLRPRDPDLRHNLAFARIQIKGKLPEVKQSMLSRLGARILEEFSLDEFTLILSGFYLVLLLGALIRILGPRGWLRRLSFYLLLAGVAGFALCSPFFAGKLYQEVLCEQAIVMKEKVNAYSGPGEENARLFDLYEGMDLVVRQRENGWSRIELKNGLSGWIPKSSFRSLSSLVTALKAAP
jgi:tetratricopeptide (TPR) repeat protein